MKLGTIRIDGKPTVIARVNDWNAVVVKDFEWMEDLIKAGDSGLTAAANAIEAGKAGTLATFDVENADWMAPNPKASKILGCAVNNNNLNKVSHRPMKSPMFFTKGRSALTGHNKTIDILPRHGRLIPEPEPVVVFGKDAKNIGPDEILDYVFGYTLTNDVTASGIKFGEDSIALKQKPELVFPHHMAWRHRFGEEDTYVYFIYHSRSKAADTFAAMGPWITTKDEIADPNNLPVRGYVDGEMYADDSTASYFFKVQEVISEATTWFTMEAGDCVHCGTAVKGTAKFPHGNLGTNLVEYNGKTTDVEVPGLGVLSNIINCVPQGTYSQSSDTGRKL